ncbi:hypothetical protein B481_1595 [Planococcus halocryophilus Or1]|nr:hypothetical protein B481_1595 [Planococcus halocryophilus Or1]
MRMNQERYRDIKGKMMHQDEIIVNESSESGKKDVKYQ